MTSGPEQDIAAASRYLLGSDESELARLDAQSALYGPSTRLLLRAAGIRQGMRVLDLGTGLGHVAFELALLVGDDGEVVGIDRSVDHLAVAELRRSTSGVRTVRFVEADVRSYQDDEPFDAVVARALLFHVSDPHAVLRHHASALSAGGRVVALDFDAGSCRSNPPVELVESRRDWIVEVFRRARLDPMIGTRLSLLLRQAGLAEVESLGVQQYLVPEDPAAAGWIANVIRSLAPQIVAAEIAGEAELTLEDYESRVARALVDCDSVFLPPALGGAWGARR
jgi:SAM-dependent methyltransferase